MILFIFFQNQNTVAAQSFTAPLKVVRVIRKKREHVASETSPILPTKIARPLNIANSFRGTPNTKTTTITSKTSKSMKPTAGAGVVASGGSKVMDQKQQQQQEEQETIIFQDGQSWSDDGDWDEPKDYDRYNNLMKQAAAFEASEKAKRRDSWEEWNDDIAISQKRVAPRSPSPPAPAPVNNNNNNSDAEEEEEWMADEKELVSKFVNETSSKIKIFKDTKSSDLSEIVRMLNNEANLRQFKRIHPKDLKRGIKYAVLSLKMIVSPQFGAKIIFELPMGDFFLPLRYSNVILEFINRDENADLRKRLEQKEVIIVHDVFMNYIESFAVNNTTTPRLTFDFPPNGLFGSLEISKGN